MTLSDVKEQAQLCTSMSRSMTTCRVRDYADTINGVAGTISSGDASVRLLIWGWECQDYPGAETAP